MTAAGDNLDRLAELLDAPESIVRQDLTDWVYAHGPALVGIARAAQDVVGWADEPQAATGGEMLLSLRLRIERARAALARLNTKEGA